MANKEERDKKILLVVHMFLENNCRLSDKEISKLTNIPSSTVGRYLSSKRTKELIGVDNFAFIKRERMINKNLGRIKGGSRKNG